MDSLESLSYPEDEAASRDTLAYRLKNAVEHFMVAKDEGGKLIGFVNGTASDEDQLTHQSMFKHVPNGKSLNIHSVVVVPELRRKGIALQMLLKYIQTQKQETSIQKIFLLTKSHLQNFYMKAGFTLVGPSAVHHGQEQWFEMTMTLRD
uniref:N-acetyltransferase domain-containing protein n=1 Tax=Arcella intermedia TaxID=1963864 RepID=A0A6B2LP75_9EUKA